MNAIKNLFVYAVAGEAHIALVNTSLRFLKHFSRHDILVVVSGRDGRVDHDQVIRLPSSEAHDDHQASILIKTSLHRIVGNRRALCCYLDSDVVAVNAQVDDVFRHRGGPVTFAADHVPMRVFSRHAVRCGCTRGACDHLRHALQRKFGVDVGCRDWQHWNGGVFLFDGESEELMDCWHEYSRRIFEDPGWRVRDQGALIAAVWKQNLHHLPLLPRLYNHIVDAFEGVPTDRRRFAAVSDYHVDDSYSLQPGGARPQPKLLHFINGTMGARGWKNWDDAEFLLRAGRRSDVAEGLGGRQ
jgi:hypothetical protein